MKKDIIKRGEPQNHVLYEPAEPLFVGSMPVDSHRLRMLRMVLCGIGALILCAAFIFVGVSAHGASGTNTDTAGQIGEMATDPQDATHTPPQLTETVEESEEESATDRYYGNDETEEQESTEEQSDTQHSPEPPYLEQTQYAYKDISEISAGEGYVVNYTSKSPDVDGLIDRGFVYSVPKNSPAPIVMIMHTHTSEQYYGEDASSRYDLDSVVIVGDRITAALNARGLSAIHCTVIHDGGENNAYISARETIRAMLKIYPSIKYVIDVHRMELRDGDGNTLATLVTKSGAAQVRLTVGTDTKLEGEWQDDLSLALALRERLNDGGSRACAPVVISHGGYNGDMCRFYLMLDVGASGNSTTQAIRAGESFARALAEVLLD